MGGTKGVNLDLPHLPPSFLKPPPLDSFIGLKGLFYFFYVLSIYSVFNIIYSVTFTLLTFLLYFYCLYYYRRPLFPALCPPILIPCLCRPPSLRPPPRCCLCPGVTHTCSLADPFTFFHPIPSSPPRCQLSVRSVSPCLCFYVWTIAFYKQEISSPLILISQFFASTVFINEAQ